jgi:PKD repeat protein
VPYIFTDSSTVGGQYMPNGTRLWSIDGRTYTSRSVTLLLNTGQNYDVLLQTTSPEGCSSVLPRSFLSGPKPRASFQILDTIFTEAPFETSFRNTSTNGSSYLWDFGDGTTDTSINPSHTYLIQGVYTVKLLVFRNRQCVDSATRVLNVIADVRPDLSVNNLNTTISNGLLSTTVMLQNVGNVEIKEVALKLQLNELGAISETYKGSILPGANTMFTFASKIIDSLNKPNTILCVEGITSVNDVRDVNNGNNRTCKALNSTFTVLDVFPNPTHNAITLNYTLPKEGALTVKIVDAMGRSVQDLADSRKTAGVYKETFDITRLPEGFYHVQFIFEEEVRNQKIIKY